MVDKEREAAEIADAVLVVIARRYDVTPAQLISDLAWVHEHRSRIKKLSLAAIAALTGILVAAISRAAWDGMTGWIR